MRLAAMSAAREEKPAGTFEAVSKTWLDVGLSSSGGSVKMVMIGHCLSVQLTAGAFFRQVRKMVQTCGSNKAAITC